MVKELTLIAISVVVSSIPNSEVLATICVAIEAAWNINITN